MQFKKALLSNIIFRSLNVAVIFLINLVFVRYTGAAESGDFFYTIAILSLIILLVSCSLEAGLTYYSSAGKQHIQSFAWMILVAACVQTVIVFVPVSLLHNTISPVWLLCFISGNILIANFSALYYAEKWYITLNAIILLTNIITLIFLYLVYTRTLIISPAKIYLVNYAVQAAVLGVVFFIKSGSAFKWPSSLMIKRVFSYSFIAFTGNISYFLVTRLDYLFVKKYCLAEALGNYVQVSKTGQLFVLLPSMAASVIFPFSAGGNEEMLGRVKLLCRVMTMMVAAAGLIFIIAGRWLFPWLFGSEFSSMYLPMIFYLPGILALCISSLLASHLSGKGYLKVNVTGSLAALIIVVAGDIIFIPKYGINAAAIISSIAYTFCMAYLMWHYYKLYGSKPRDFISIHPGTVRLLFNTIQNVRN